MERANGIGTVEPVEQAIRDAPVVDKESPQPGLSQDELNSVLLPERTGQELDVEFLGEQFNALTALLEQTHLLHSVLEYHPFDDSYVLSGASRYSAKFGPMRDTLQKCREIAEKMVRLDSLRPILEPEPLHQIVVRNRAITSEPLFSIEREDGGGHSYHIDLKFDDALRTLDSVRIDEIETARKAEQINEIVREDLGLVGWHTKPTVCGCIAIYDSDDRCVAYGNFNELDSLLQAISQCGCIAIYDSDDRCVAYGNFNELDSLLQAISQQGDQSVDFNADNLNDEDRDRFTDELLHKEMGRLIADGENDFGVLPYIDPNDDAFQYSGNRDSYADFDREVQRIVCAALDRWWDRQKTLPGSSGDAKPFKVLPPCSCADFHLAWTLKDYLGHNVLVTDDTGKVIDGAKKVLDYLYKLKEAKVVWDEDDHCLLRQKGADPHVLVQVARQPESFGLDSQIFIIDGGNDVVETTPRKQIKEYYLGEEWKDWHPQELESLNDPIFLFDEERNMVVRTTPLAEGPRWAAIVETPDGSDIGWRLKGNTLQRWNPPGRNWVPWSAYPTQTDAERELQHALVNEFERSAFKDWYLSPEDAVNAYMAKTSEDDLLEKFRHSYNFYPTSELAGEALAKWCAK